jgi:Na+/H+ antiporter NhaD/arsenite permease-like protein
MWDFIIVWFLTLLGAVIVVVLGNLATVIVVWPWLRQCVRKIEVKQWTSG